MEIKIITRQTSLDELKEIATEGFGDMVKAVVDVERGRMAVGGELHSDEEQMLLVDGSQQDDLWGINLYTEVEAGEWLEFDSMINVRPRQGNRSRGVEDADTRQRISEIVKTLVSR